ncbi:hypothetical protein GGI20_003127 [Coemansia sp. BCRC 34301]|nr:hypothetical protein GGI20_003127 [Coemansia sp. BCRC 34301]
MRSLGMRQQGFRSKSAFAVAAWGAYLGRFAKTKPSAALAQSESQALLVPTRLCLDSLVGPNISSPRITAMGAGVRHALIAFNTCERTHTTQLLGVGLNRCQQLGRMATNTTIVPLVTTVSGKVAQVACGREHSALLVESPDGSTHVAVCGSNAFGQLGLDTTPGHSACRHSSVPQSSAVSKVAALDGVLESGESIVKVQCGLDHTIVLSSRGRAFAMGWAADGQLGAGLESKATTCNWPVPVSGLDGVMLTDISASTDFALALTADNRLYYWGNAEYGQCMTGAKIDQVLTPLQVPFGLGRIAGIAAGGCHALVLTDDGRVYSCGYGALGLGPATVATLQPTQIDGLGDIQAIYSSTDRSLAVDSQRRMYTWGLGNSAGRLGNGSVGENVYRPELLDTSFSPADTLMVALGNDMALVAAAVSDT